MTLSTPRKRPIGERNMSCNRQWNTSECLERSMVASASTKATKAFYLTNPNQRKLTNGLLQQRVE